MNKKKTGAILLGLALGLSGTALAAPDNGTDAAGSEDSRIAALEQQQQELAAQIKALKEESANQAENQKKQADAVDSVKKDQDHVKLYGFVRTSWDNDADRNKGDIYDDEKTNSRFYLNLMADMKISDNWTGHLQSETNQRFAHSTLDGKLKREDGQIQRIWVDGKLKNGGEISIGRKWSPLGYQFSLLGATTNGVDLSYPVTPNGLRAGAYYYSMGEYSNADFSFYGPFVKGPVGHNFDIFCAYAKISGGGAQGLQTPYVDGDYGHGNWIGTHAFVLSAATNVAKNLRLTTDYVQTNHENDLSYNYDNRANFQANNRSWITRLDYKWTNPEVVGSFAAYLRYHNIQRNGTIWNDDAWGSMLRNSKGWTIGFRYVPWKNVEWETMWAPHLTENSDANWAGGAYTRHILRSWLDFHF